MKLKNLTCLLVLLGFVFLPGIRANLDTSKVDLIDQNGSKKISFASKRDGNFEIYTINADGTELKRLTNSKDDDLKPQWSPDGSKIMYLSKKGKKYSLKVMNSDGSGQVKLINECSSKYLPSWSPDGSKILFVAEYKTKNRIYTVNPDGGNLICLTKSDTEGFYPSWSPDGLKILYIEKYRRKSYIYTINPDGSERVKLTSDNETYLAPAWSPDGQKIAFIATKKSIRGATNHFFVMNSDGSNKIEIADGSRKIEDIDYYDQFYWSSDGTSISLVKVAEVDAKYDDSGNAIFTYEYGAYIVGTDGNDYDKLIAKMGNQPLPLDWSPDSSKVAFLSRSKVTIYNVKTNIDEEIQVGTSIPLSPIKWSPDGTKLVFAGKNHSFQKAGLYLVTLDGKVTKLTEDNDYDPVWAPAKEKHDAESEM